MSKRSRAGWRRNAALVLANATQCSYCGGPISRHLPRGHPQKATVDHIVSVAEWRARYGTEEGVNQLGNLCAACWRCNSRKGDRPPSVLAAPEQRSRQWYLMTLLGGPIT